MPVLSASGLNRTLHNIFHRLALGSNSPPQDGFQNVGPLFIKVLDLMRGPLSMFVT